MKHISLLAALLLPTSVTWAGLQFEARISAPQTGETQTTGYVDGPKAKIDFREGMPSAAGVSGYLITQDGGETLYLVDPDSKSYMQFDPAHMAGTAGNMMQAAEGVVQIEVQDPSVKKLFEREGPVLQGYETRHVKLQTAYTLHSSMLGQQSTVKVDQTDEMWVTDKLHAPGLNLWLQQSSIRTGSKDFDKLIELEQSRINGFPLKIVSTRTETKPGGKPQTTKTVYEITSIEERTLPPAIFEIPAGYSDGMANARQQMGRALQSIEESSQDPAAQEAVKSVMQGILER